MIYETRKIGRVSILFEARIEIDSGNSVLGFGGFISWKESENPGGVEFQAIS